MNNKRTDEAEFDAALAHGLARVALGLNTSHARVRPFAESCRLCERNGQAVCCDVSSGTACYTTGCGIAIGEAIIGTLLFLGLFCRPVLVIGTLLMLLLIFGSALIQQWEIVSDQMIYIAFYVVLLATVRYDRFSLQGLRRRE